VRYVWVSVLICAALSYAVFDEGAGVRTWLRLRGEVRAADVRIARVRADNERLRRDVERLDSDPFALERAIREDLHLTRAGETLLLLPGSGRSNPRFP